MSEQRQYYELYVPPNPLAGWSLGFGIAAIVTSIFGIGALLGLVALILGILAARRQSRQGSAITGIVLGACALAIGSLVTLFVVNVVFAARRAIAGAPAAQASMMTGMLKTSVEEFEADTKRFPTAAEGLDALEHKPAGLTTWKGPYFGTPRMVDPWGRPYRYIIPSPTNPAGFEIRCDGPDRLGGTADDIVEVGGPTPPP